MRLVPGLVHNFSKAVGLFYPLYTKGSQVSILKEQRVTFVILAYCFNRW